MDDFVAAVQAMPGWVQFALLGFIGLFIVMVAETPLRNRGMAARFAVLARARQAAVTPGPDGYTASFETAVDGRTVTVQRERRATSRGSSYRGPRGFLTLLLTPLAGPRWSMHNIDIAERGTLARLGSTPLRTGDTVFDQRFTVWQDGVVVRDGWLDAPTRAALTALFDVPSMADAGTVWVTEGRLQVLHDTPKVLDPVRLDALLGRVSVLATALERTSGWRGPSA